MTDGGSRGEGRRTEHRTLFAVPLADPRERRMVAGSGRKRRDPDRFRSSDTSRHRPMLVAALVGVVGVIAAYLWQSPAVSFGTGALALPHETAKLTCGSCHQEGEPRAKAAEACARCHGPHPSRRSGHARLRRAGEMRCVDCHAVHTDDQGLRITATGKMIRYSVGASAPIEGPALLTPHDVTVPLVPLTRCRRCHDPRRASDPIGRCVRGEVRPGAIAVCFDEHQAWSAVAPLRPGGVCKLQHGNDRFAAWEAAREVVSAEAPERGAGAEGSLWLAVGGLSAAVGGLGYAGALRLRRRRRRKEVAPAMKPADRVRLPQIDTTTCLGCYACVDACPYDVLAVERYVAVVVRPEACCGLTLCEQVCPNGSLVITDGDPIGDHPQVGDDLQARDVPGLYLAGDVTGLPLIKNAILQGRRAVEAIAAEIPRHDRPLDLLVVGAGPAGISAALAAKEQGLSCEVVEQGSVAQSIRSFPRGKLVFDQPLDLPVAGKLWLQEATKEELLTKWLRVVREERLTIHEGERFTGLRREGEGFVATLLASDGDGEEREISAARILLAIGQRGTARKLPVELSSEVESKVFYHLADARSFVGQRLLVVGLGDVAMETAIALARQHGTAVTVSYRGDGFKRGKARNIAEMKRLVEAGAMKVVWSSEVERVAVDEVTLKTANGTQTIENDAVFVMIGVEPPRALLGRLGVEVGVTATLEPENSENFRASEASEGEPVEGT
ncbi:MAG TPA: FAD-binding protein [Polyangiaceae bacterium]|nr:FAD-binding protein [Polyangiaceae bacterium]